MKTKRSLKSRIRGWFPKEPKLPNQSQPIQTPPNQKPLMHNKLSRLWIVAAVVLAEVFVISNLFLGFSPKQIILVIVVGTLVGSFLLFRRTSFQRVSRFLKYVAIIVFVFVLCFNGIGAYLFVTSGYPPTDVPQLSYPDILNVSLTQYFQSLEQSQNFRFLQLQHFGTIYFGKLSLWAYAPPTMRGATGYVEWTFYPSDEATSILIGNDARQAYYTSSQFLFYKVSYQTLPSIQNMKKTFGQIDNLGIGWFQKQALDMYQNKTGSNLEIGGLRLGIAYDNLTNYQGITVQLSTFGKSLDNNGNIIYSNGFSAEFQPNGTLLTFS